MGTFLCFLLPNVNWNWNIWLQKVSPNIIYFCTEDFSGKNSTNSKLLYASAAVEISIASIRYYNTTNITFT